MRHSPLSLVLRVGLLAAAVLAGVGCRSAAGGSSQRLHGPVAEVGFTVRPTAASQGAFDRLDPASQWDVISDVWSQVDRAVPGELLGLVGLHAVDVDERGYPRTESLRELRARLRRAGGRLFDGDPPPAPPCIYDRITGLSIKCGEPLPIALRHLWNGGMPLEFEAHIEVHIVFPRPLWRPAPR